MTLPYDGWSLAAIACAAVCLWMASRRSLTLSARVGCVAAAALVIRLDPAWQLSLHAWDESVHALVAKRLVLHPLVPRLYEPSGLPLSLDDWTEMGIWLHKPPLALWLMAASLATFGVHALAVRLPSLLLSTLGVVATFLIGRKVFDARVGLLAAGFHAVNGLLVSLSSGRRVADHVDTALIACVQFGVLAIVSVPDHRRATRSAWLAGAAMGLGLLAKSLPALVIAVVAIVAWVSAYGMRRGATLLGRLLASAAIVCLPWIIYTRFAFADAARRADEYTLRHITTVIEGHGGSVWSYVLSMPHFFGELVYLPVAWFVVSAARRNATAFERAIVAWLVVPFVVFSFMATKLSGFIAIAAPALFLAEAAIWVTLKDSLGPDTSRLRRRAAAILLALLVVLPARYLLEPTGAFERRDRYPPSTRQFMELDQTLRLPRAVIFNVSRPYELMFYSSYVAYGRMPSPEEVEELHRQDIPILIYQPNGTSVTPPPEWRARVLPGR